MKFPLTVKQYKYFYCGIYLKTVWITKGWIIEGALSVLVIVEPLLKGMHSEQGTQYSINSKITLSVHQNNYTT